MTTSASPSACARSSSSVIAARVAALADDGLAGHRLDEVAPAGRAVGVEVLEDDEAGTGGAGRGEHPALERRELLRPGRVAAGVEAEVDRVGAAAHAGREPRVGGVAADDLGAGDGAAAVAVDGADLDAVVDEGLGDEPADLAGAEDDVTGHGSGLQFVRGMDGGSAAVAARRRRASGRTTVSAVTTRAPLEPNTVNARRPGRRPPW